MHDISDTVARYRRGAREGYGVRRGVPRASPRCLAHVGAQYMPAPNGSSSARGDAPGADAWRTLRGLGPWAILHREIADLRPQRGGPRHWAQMDRVFEGVMESCPGRCLVVRPKVRGLARRGRLAGRRPGSRPCARCASHATRRLTCSLCKSSMPANAASRARVGGGTRVHHRRNHKGGVGKTATVPLGTLLVATGRRVLLVDMDPSHPHGARGGRGGGMAEAGGHWGAVRCAHHPPAGEGWRAPADFVGQRGVGPSRGWGENLAASPGELDGAYDALIDCPRAWGCSPSTRERPGGAHPHTGPDVDLRVAALS